MKNNIIRDAYFLIKTSANYVTYSIVIFINTIFSLILFYQSMQFAKEFSPTMSYFFLWNYSDVYNILLVYTFSFLLIIKPFFYINQFELLKILKYKNEKYRLKVIITAIIITGFFFFLIVTAIYSIESIILLPFGFEWVDAAIEKWPAVYIAYNKQYIFPILMFAFFNNMLRLICMGLLYFTFYHMIKNIFFARLLMIAGIFFELLMYKNKWKDLYGYSFIGNTAMGFDNLPINFNVNIFYWLVAMILIIAAARFFLLVNDAVEI